MSRRRRLLCLVVASAALGAVVSCGGVASTPRDSSNASAHVTTITSATIANVHAVREVTPSREALALLAAPDRDPRDRALDAERQAGELLTFLDVRQGGRVAHIGAGAGYVTELLARAVGRDGVVFGVNPAQLAFAPPVDDAWSERLSKPANRGVVRIDRTLDDPLPPDVRELDLVYLGLYYRDLPSLGVHPPSLVRTAFHTLRRGGTFVVLDYAPVAGGATISSVRGLESKNVRNEVEEAGFVFVSKGDFLRPSPDAPSDRFLLTFVKP